MQGRARRQPGPDAAPSSSCASGRGSTGPATAAWPTPSSTSDIAGREYQATNPDTDELRTPYLENDQLDLSAWARDALVLALPDKILCRPDCAGLCPVCGRDLNDEPHGHDDEEPDSRWAALSELRDKL